MTIIKTEDNGYIVEYISVKVKLITNGKIPVKKTVGASCFDCYARIENKTLVLAPGERRTIPLGFGLDLPFEYEAVIRPRSGLSKIGIDSIIGTIDSDYRGEVNAILINKTGEYFKIENGDRICQMKIQHAPMVKLELVPELSETERGCNGFGSTGI